MSSFAAVLSDDSPRVIPQETDMMLVEVGSASKPDPSASITLSRRFDIHLHDDELMEAVMGLSSVGVNSGWSDSTGGGNLPLLNTGSSEYSITVIRSHPSQQTVPPSLSSILNHPCFTKSKQDTRPSTTSGRLQL
ncbi:uncharacterized protein ARMOST_22259 [Armillaria ostoyae]|uniref:Uncharacterized protein n=1 Tax=Armillaria ostoyae TaxID=47428 RepID=A0A284SCD0_ARMOS|nr:uncharacterized protein ARMOST_22259 [Armillaria ostoyae]